MVASEQNGRSAAGGAQSCWLCTRPLGRRVEWHHPVPKSRGGKMTAPVHPICHRTLHATFTNAELARFGADALALRGRVELQPFLRWIASKPPDFHAPTARRK
ncbi:HNH endonuclease [Novosphingobium olei]|uniref:HNH endonuclease n=1 Tax=Novosphingobium olei TaxID=2728851 RepID=A0A7Y0BQT2_9SPHN|nr:HNH endonuclease [Novosphingobium olei]NML94819.1 HNH endonuclease [Novosphingobium olei]